ncbi:MAG: penicillin-binding protein [Bacteroidetes bacterium]|nr:penicillin-binding protein [Bacteroidota bacterium]
MANNHSMLDKSLRTLKGYSRKLRKQMKAFRKAQPKLFWVVTLSGGLFLLSFVSVLFLSLLVYKGAFGKLPTYAQLQEIKNFTASEVYSEEGVLLGKYYIQNRVNADFEEISPFIINALVATEDARFFKHSGVDIKAAFRVLIKSILFQNESSGGGSTLSQQLAKNLYPRKNHGLLTIPANKIREMFIARRLERIYNKNYLLNLYLNTVPFSQNIFGVKVAAQRFFNTSPQEIKLEEAAVLVGMLKGTTLYNPIRHPERARARRNVVLHQMSKYEYLPTVNLDSLYNLPITLRYHQEGNNQGMATYFREHLRLKLEDRLKQIKKPDGSTYNLYTDGLKIHTTINARLQQFAEEAVNEQMSQLQKDFYQHWKKGLPWGKTSVLKEVVRNSSRYKALKSKGLSEKEIDKIFNTPVNMTVFDWKSGEVEKELSPLDSIKYYLTLLNTGFLAMDPGTGQIKAWVGGINHKYFKYDHVKSKRQVGSIFKPIVFAKAIQSGIPPCEYIPNDLVIYSEYDDWMPRNSDEKYGGYYSMEGGLSHSVNSVTVDMITRTEVDSVRHLAQQLGISSEIPSVPSIALGAVDASLYDMLKVFGTFANRGVRPEPNYILYLENNQGDVLFEHDHREPGEFEQVLTEDQADMMTHMLQTVVDSGTARRLRYEFGLYNDIAGKTGTTQNQSDGWFIGFTPELVAGAWVGAELPSVHFRTLSLGQGANTALPIWGKFMEKVSKDPIHKKLLRSYFPEPSDSVLLALDCPPFVEELPAFSDDIFENAYLLEELLNFFRKKEEKVHISTRKRTYMPPSKESERIRKKNERLEKRRNRKKNRRNIF